MDMNDDFKFQKNEKINKEKKWSQDLSSQSTALMLYALLKSSALIIPLSSSLNALQLYINDC